MMLIPSTPPPDTDKPLCPQPTTVYLESLIALPPLISNVFAATPRESRLMTSSSTVNFCGSASGSGISSWL